MPCAQSASQPEKLILNLRGKCWVRGWRRKCVATPSMRGVISTCSRGHTPASGQAVMLRTVLPQASRVVNPAAAGKLDAHHVHALLALAVYALLQAHGGKAVGVQLPAEPGRDRLLVAIELVFVSPEFRATHVRLFAFDVRAHFRARLNPTRSSSVARIDRHARSGTTPPM